MGRGVGDGAGASIGAGAGTPERKEPLCVEKHPRAFLCALLSTLPRSRTLRSPEGHIPVKCGGFNVDQRVTSMTRTPENDQVWALKLA